MTGYTTAFLSASALLSAWFLYRLQNTSGRNPRKLPFPPGPTPLPILGNALDLPRYGTWLKYTEWQKAFGDILHVEVLGRHIIVCNSYKTANELLDKQAIFSGRPVLWMAGKLMGWEKSITVQTYNDTWRKQRRILHPIMNKTGSRQFHPLIEKETAYYLQRLLKEPDAFVEHFRLTAARQIAMATYGLEVQSLDDDLIVTSEKAIHAIVFAGIPGSFLVDMFPLLRFVPTWFPGAGFHTYARNAKVLIDRMVGNPFDICKQHVIGGLPNSSFTADLLRAEENEADKESYEDLVKWTSGTMYAAGSDTSLSAIHTFVLAMVLHPTVQANAQKELDIMIGPLHRLPKIEDRENLPYIECVVKEVLRWHPVAPLALPHSLTEDNYFEGYYLPKDAVVFGNVWAISRDTSIYPDPETFNPERFEVGPDVVPPLDPREYIFGFGRRKCAGLNFGNDAIFMAIASMLATLNFSKSGDEEIRGDYTLGLISHPEPFKCTIKPRSENFATLIHATASNS